MAELFKWFGTKFKEDFQFTKYLLKINEVENQSFAVRSDKISPLYLIIGTTFLSINSGILTLISLYKFGFGAKFLSIAALTIYLNLSWHWVGYKYLFKGKLN